MAKRRNTDNIRIAPVKFMTKEQHQLVVGIFAANYRSKNGGLNNVPYDAAREYTDLVFLYDDNRMIGFMTIMDIDRVVNSTEKKYNGVWQGAAEFWRNADRSVNRRQIELLWIHPQYRGLGLATTLYRYALECMGVTQIHVDVERVLPRIDYWRALGFTKFFLNILGDLNGVPTLKLHIEDSSPFLNDLNAVSLYSEHHHRDVNI